MLYIVRETFVVSLVYKNCLVLREFLSCTVWFETMSNHLNNKVVTTSHITVSVCRLNLALKIKFIMCLVIFMSKIRAMHVYGFHNLGQDLGIFV